MKKSIELRTNIVDKRDVDKLTEHVIKTLSESLAMSLGPHGQTTIIEEPHSGHRMTKDGFTILKEIRFDESVCKSIYGIIREISQQLVMTVGDGSTSCIVAAYNFYVELKKLMEDNSSAVANIRPQGIVDALDEIVAGLIVELKKFARPVSEDMHELSHLASVSINNNSVLGDLVSEIYTLYGLDSFITVTFGNALETKYEVTKGFQLNAGLEDVCMSNSGNDDNPIAQLDNAAVLVFAETCNNKTAQTVIHNALMEVVREKSIAIEEKRDPEFSTLLILAPGYSDEIWQYFADKSQSRNAANGMFNFIRLNYGTKAAVNSVEDLCTLTGARKIFGGNYDDQRIAKGEINVREFFGIAEQIITDEKHTTISGCNCSESTVIKDAIKTTSMKLKRLKSDPDYDINEEYVLTKRLAVLKQTLITIVVGGSSEQKRKTNKDLIDDAVAACRSALEHGYTVGGNLSIPIILDRKHKEQVYSSPDKQLECELVTALGDSFLNVYAQVLANAGIVGEEANIIMNKSIETGEMYDIIKKEYTSDRIINSIETEMEIVKTMVSIISLLLTSNQFVQDSANPRMVHYKVGYVEVGE